MSPVTVVGSVGGATVAVAVSAQVQQELAQRIITLASEAGASPQVVTASGPTVVSSSVVIANGASGNTIVGSPSVPEVYVLMAGQQGCFVTGGTTLSTVVAADGSNSSVVNDNPSGALVAVTGSGGNVLEGLSGANQFVTAANGQDIVVAAGAANRVESGGADALLVGGPTTISAGMSGIDNVLLTAGTTLAFINGSTAGVSTITGGAGCFVVVAGTGNTSVVAGVGVEEFFVDSSAGNVTLNGGLSNHDVLTFIRGVNTGHAEIHVANFGTNDTVKLQGYAGDSLSGLASTSEGAVLSLSDGSKITFDNASTGSVRSMLTSG